MLTGDPTIEALERAAAIGVCAFWPKDGSLSSLLEALRHAQSGGFTVHPSLVAHASAHWRLQDSVKVVAALTHRELEVLRLMAAGHDVRANAHALGIAENTCRGYVKSILAKLEAHSQLEAVVVATKLGLVPWQNTPGFRVVADDSPSRFLATPG
ncbi:response regulator transcription factor [Arthrobacter alpinus]|nr:response regulator transcription factor [Arthrobacter alpinus]